MLQVTSLDLHSRELLHHYTTHACFTLAINKFNDVWQNAIPQMALSYPFLMHGILAVSALHLAVLQPSRKHELLQRASISEHLALPSFRQTVAENKPENIHAVLAFAGFVVRYILALSTESKGRIPSFDDENPHWFHALRGLVSLVANNWLVLDKGPFSPFLNRVAVPIEYSRNPDDVHFAKVHQLLSSSSTPEDVHDMDVYRAALDELRRVAALAFSPCKTIDNLGAVYIWPGSVDQEFLLLLNRRKPEALVIFAYYCVLLKKINWKFWYFDGVGEGILFAIRDELGPEFQEWIEWPLQQKPTVPLQVPLAQNFPRTS
jgi:hypothetical protein